MTLVQSDTSTLINSFMTENDFFSNSELNSFEAYQKSGKHAFQLTANDLATDMVYRIPAIHGVLGYTSPTPALFQIPLLEDYASVTQSSCKQNLNDPLT